MALDLQKKIAIATRGFTEPEIKLKLARAARDTLAEMISSGEGSPNYYRFVNGRPDVPEENVVLPGPIFYQFNWLDEAAKFALAFLRARWNVRGPGRGGHFQDSYFIMGGEKEITVEEVKNYDRITIVNDKPYARKAQVGTKGFLVPRGLYEDCRQAVMRHFGRKMFTVEIKYLTLAGGYMLRRRKKKVSATGLSTGEQMRYPAVVISLV